MMLELLSEIAKKAKAESELEAAQGPAEELIDDEAP